MKSIFVTSGYGRKTLAPFVQVEHEAIDEPIQLSPAEARDLAQNLIQAAEASEQDAFLFEFTRDALKQDQATAAQLIGEYRAWRENKHKQSHNKPSRR